MAREPEGVLQLIVARNAIDVAQEVGVRGVWQIVMEDFSVVGPVFVVRVGRVGLWSVVQNTSLWAYANSCAAAEIPALLKVYVIACIHVFSHVEREGVAHLTGQFGETHDDILTVGEFVSLASADVLVNGLSLGCESA